MRKKLLFCFCITLLTVTPGSAQGRQITNLDLQKYRDARVAADKELGENYEKLGFPSPEELERRREKSRVETERLDVQREIASRHVTVYSRDIRQNDGYLSSGYYYSPYVNRYPRPRTQGQPGYFAGGQFWPTGPATRPRPLFIRPRNR